MTIGPRGVEISAGVAYRDMRGALTGVPVTARKGP